SAAHVAFMSRQALAAQPATTARADGATGRDVSPAAPGTAAASPARDGVTGERAAPVPVGRWVPDGAQDGGGRPGSRRTPRDRLALAGRGRARLIVFGAAGATGMAVAAVVLTQFLTSPAAQTTGASALPTAHVTGSRPAGVARPASHPLPSADA